MQCLFCGKELALLKRLRGGAEFCSEAHRKEYQEQYEQLALARLMQAKQPAEAPSLSPAPLGRTAKPLPSADPGLQNPLEELPAPPQQQYQSHPSPSVATMEAPAPRQPAGNPAPEKPAEGPSPAPMAGFLNEPVVPAVTPFERAAVLELLNTPPSLPDLALTVSASSEAQGSLPAASSVDLRVSLQALDHHTRISQRGMEVREFAGPAPVMELDLRPNSGTEPAGSADVMEILMSPHPPRKAKPWLGVPRGFPSAPAELGELARLDFATTGFAYSDGAVSAGPVTATSAPPAAVRPPEPPQGQLAPKAAVAPPQPAPVPAAEPPAPAEPLPPALVTRVLPVTLHGLAAPRAKLAQSFGTPLTTASDVQAPPSAALPLRPTIVFGPRPATARAPEAATAAAPPSPAQSKPAQPKPATPVPAKPVPVKTVQPKPAQETAADARTEERARPSVVPAPKPVQVKQQTTSPLPEKTAPKVSTPAPAADPRPDQPAEPRIEPRVEPRKEWLDPQPLQASASSDSIPSLRLQATESAWSKLSTGLKIGLAAAVIVAVSGIAYVVTRGNGKPATQLPAAAPAAPAVATGVAISGGWIDDWANVAKSKRHISLLSGSAKLSDYRMEFQAQIETKAVGWVFRGLNPRNYYVAKIETITPGLEPTVALVHFAVVDGQDESRVVVPLPMKVRVDTTYKVRFDAIGNRFTAWVQGEKVAEWTDSRFGSGGVGFFSEKDEHAAMQGAVNVVPLVPKN